MTEKSVSCNESVVWETIRKRWPIVSVNSAGLHPVKKRLMDSDLSVKKVGHATRNQVN